MTSIYEHVLFYGRQFCTLAKAMTTLQSQSTSNLCSVSQAATTEALLGPQDYVAEHSLVFQGRRDAVVIMLNAIAGITCHSPYGSTPFFRFSIATSMQVLEEGCARLRRACEKLV